MFLNLYVYSLDIDCQNVSIGSGNGSMAIIKNQVIVWTNDGSAYWHICA